MGYNEVREVVGPKRTLEILELLEEESPLNYSTIEEEVPTSSDTISKRLDVLTEYNLAVRKERSKKDVRYSISKKGKEVLENIREISLILQNQADGARD